MYIYDAAMITLLKEPLLTTHVPLGRYLTLERATLRFFCVDIDLALTAILLKIRESLKTRTDHIGEWLDGSQCASMKMVMIKRIWRRAFEKRPW